MKSQEIMTEINKLSNQMSDLRARYEQAKREEDIAVKAAALAEYKFAIPVYGYSPLGDKCVPVTPEMLLVATRDRDGFMWSSRPGRGSFDDGEYYILVKTEIDGIEIRQLLKKLAAAKSILDSGWNMASNATELTGITFPKGWRP